MEHEILTPQTVEIIVGATAIIGAIIIVASLLLAKALGFIRFGKKVRKDREGSELKVCPVHDDLLKGQKNLAQNHKDLEVFVKSINENQIRNMEKHEEHKKSFESGEKMMKKLACDIKNLSIGIAVLLDRQPKRKVIEGLKLDVGSLIKILTTEHGNGEDV